MVTSTKAGGRGGTLKAREMGRGVQCTAEMSPFGEF